MKLFRDFDVFIFLKIYFLPKKKWSPKIYSFYFLPMSIQNFLSNPKIILRTPCDEFRDVKNTKTRNAFPKKLYFSWFSMKMTQSSSWEPWKSRIFFPPGPQNPACRPLVRQLSPSSEGVRWCSWALGLPTWVVLHNGTTAGHQKRAQGCLNSSGIFFPLLSRGPVPVLRWHSTVIESNLTSELNLTELHLWT